MTKILVISKLKIVIYKWSDLINIKYYEVLTIFTMCVICLIQYFFNKLVVFLVYYIISVLK